MIGGESHCMQHESNQLHLVKDCLIELCMVCTIPGKLWSLSLHMFSSWLVGTSHERSKTQTSRFFNCETLQQSTVTCSHQYLQFFTCIQFFSIAVFFLCLELLFVYHRLCTSKATCAGAMLWWYPELFFLASGENWIESFLWHCYVLYLILFHNQDSSVYILTSLWAAQSWFKFLAGARDFSLLQNIQTCTGSHPAPYSVCTNCSFLWGEGAVVWGDHSPLCSAVPVVLPYAFTVSIRTILQFTFLIWFQRHCIFLCSVE